MISTSAAARSAAQRVTLRNALIGGVGVLLLLSIVRYIANADDLTSSGAFEQALKSAVPILLAGLGGLYAERCGVVNIGLEGMMILGTWFGAWGGWMWGPWWGVAIGVAGGAAGGLIHAVATVTFNVDHIVSGVAINILGAGVARFLSSIAYTPETGGGVTQSPGVGGHIGVFSVPVLAGGDVFGWHSPDVLDWLDTKRWFFASDVAGVLHGLMANLSLLTILALALVPATWWLLWRTRFGLRLRSVGENPSAAESLGVAVVRPSWPWSLLPKQNTLPTSSTMHVWNCPHATWRTFLTLDAPPVSGPVNLPFACPHWPARLLPQQ